MGNDIGKRYFGEMAGGLNNMYGFAATADMMAYLGIAQVNKED
jgi:hypothetical protein